MKKMWRTPTDAIPRSCSPTQRGDRPVASQYCYWYRLDREEPQMSHWGTLHGARPIDGHAHLPPVPHTMQPPRPKEQSSIGGKTGRVRAIDKCRPNTGGQRLGSAGRYRDGSEDGTRWCVVVGRWSGWSTKRTKRSKRTTRTKRTVRLMVGGRGGE